MKYDDSHEIKMTNESYETIKTLWFNNQQIYNRTCIYDLLI